MTDSSHAPTFSAITLRRPVGIGRASVVWLAEDEQEGQQYAVRVIDLEDM